MGIGIRFKRSDLEFGVGKSKLIKGELPFPHYLKLPEFDLKSKSKNELKRLI